MVTDPVCKMTIDENTAKGNERPIVTYSEPKSLSRETTFERDLHAQDDREALSRIFTELCRDVSEDLKRSLGVRLQCDVAPPGSLGDQDAGRRARRLSRQ